MKKRPDETNEVASIRYLGEIKALLKEGHVLIQKKLSSIQEELIEQYKILEDNRKLDEEQKDNELVVVPFVLERILDELSAAPIDNQSTLSKDLASLLDSIDIMRETSPEKTAAYLDSFDLITESQTPESPDITVRKGDKNVSRGVLLRSLQTLPKAIRPGTMAFELSKKPRDQAGALPIVKKKDKTEIFQSLLASSKDLIVTNLEGLSAVEITKIQAQVDNQLKELEMWKSSTPPMSLSQDVHDRYNRIVTNLNAYKKIADEHINALSRNLPEKKLVFTKKEISVEKHQSEQNPEYKDGLLYISILSKYTAGAARNRELATMRRNINNIIKSDDYKKFRAGMEVSPSQVTAFEAIAELSARLKKARQSGPLFNIYYKMKVREQLKTIGQDAIISGALNDILKKELSKEQNNEVTPAGKGQAPNKEG